ncbi:putative lipoyltransferase 2, mitochondrial [Bactrocera dorsalis]|uniref:Octanoyl-[acyl-carrier-protein]:protein N-octanoyltransferase LIPT2, mitochondrial n=1 Tax=Bactrocera dorsalis TaxID=27457 RepID=A0A6I9W3T8_BACDO|nr:putative lipoyltransferase 2, mitochondrial [Bactrocera dorsalis]
MMKKAIPLVTIVNAGHHGYESGLKLQKQLSNQKAEDWVNFRNYLILQQHDPVYTIGIRTKNYSDADEQRLRKLGAEFFRTNRGGLITFHGPGQLVAYPILHLHQFHPKMRWYVATLEKTVIETCRKMGIPQATTTSDTGIWVGNNKICAIGVHGSRYVTTHGIGLNCCTDLRWFEHIVPCGIEGKGVTSLSNELQRNVCVEEAAKVFVRCFAEHFKCQIQEKVQ